MRAYSRGFFSPHYIVEDAGESVELRASGWLRVRAAFDLDGAAYELRREGFLGSFVLERDGDVVARADKRAFQSAFDVEIGHYGCSLAKTSFFGNQFGLFEGDEQVGSIRKGMFTSEVAADLDFIRALPAKVFVVWLALLLWKRQDASAGE